MNINTLLILALIGILTGIAGVHYFNNEKTIIDEPVSTSYNPFQNGTYAKCIIEPTPTSNGTPSPYLLAHCYVNEILVPDLPLESNNIEAILFLRGGNFEGLTVEFVKIDPTIIPDPDKTTHTRVLPIWFRFQKPANYNIFPGQSVDMYIKNK